MQLPPGKKVYFLSDFHLGIPDAAQSRERERMIVRFLDEARQDAAAIFVVGDVFDFWYEYKYVVPKGYTRLLGKWAELSDSGIAMHFFVGNHDMWMRSYFQEELGTPVYFEPRDFSINNRLFHIGHGDGLGPGDKGYKALKKLFRNPIAQWCFGMLPPRIGIGLADYFSLKSKNRQTSEEPFLGPEREWLISYCKDVLTKKNVDYFVFGHRHLPIDYRLSSTSRYINLGDWIIYFTYAVFDGNRMELKSYAGKDEKVIRVTDNE